MKDFKKDFPVLSRYTYLNTASSGLLSKELIAWRHEHDMNLLDAGSVFRDGHKLHIQRIRETVGRFFGTSEKNVALVPSFSFGFNTFLDGFISHGSADRKLKFLLLERDYPSVNWAVENRDVEVCYTIVDEHLEDNILKAVKTHQPDVFAFSVVQYLSGIRIDLDFLKQLKNEFPRLLLVADGTQFLGADRFDFSESPIDAIGASGYKWLLSGYGNGFFLVKEDIQLVLDPVTIGFNSADATYGKREGIPVLRKLEPGHQDTLSYGSLEFGINYLDRLGMDWIEEKNRSLSVYAKKRFFELGLLEPMVARRNRHSTIFNIKANDQVFDTLKDAGVICSRRAKGLRLSCHFYNSEEDIEQLISLL